MLAAPLPASADTYIADPTYGKTSTSDSNWDRAALGGYTDTLGIDAVTISGQSTRYVLGQRMGGGDPRPFHINRFTAAGVLDTTFDSDGDYTYIPGTGVAANIPATFTATKLTTNGTDLFITGTAVVSGVMNIVVVKVLAATGALDTSFDVDGIAFIATGLASTTYAGNFYVVDVASPGAVTVAVSASAGAVHDNRIYQLTALGAAAAGAGFSGSGQATLPGAVATAMSLGGITVLASNKIAGTAQVAGTASDSTSVVYQLLSTGAVDTAFVGGGAVQGQSVDLDTKFDSMSWYNEGLGDLVEGTTPGLLVISGGAGNNLFLARVSATGTVDTTFNDTGISDTVTSGCTGNDPELAYSTIGAPSARYWLTNDCGSNGEVFRYRTSGAADAAFGTGGLVRLSPSDFGFNGSVTAEPATFAANGDVVVGAGTISTVVSQPQYDIAGWRIVASTPASITTQPNSQSVAVNANPTFTVVVAGSPTPTVQWQSAAPGSDNFSDLTDGFGISNSATATLTVSGVVAGQNGTRYRARVSNGGAPIFSSPATLSIIGTPEVVSQPANRSTSADGPSVTFTTGYIGNTPITASWEMKSGDGDWKSLSGSWYSVSSGTGTTSLTVNHPPKSLDGTWYRVTLVNALGRTMSLPATLEVTGDKPTPPTNVAWADYDGDGKSDIATFRPSDGSFNWMKTQEKFGKAGDKAIVGNFDSDKASDMAVVRGNTWMIDHEDPVAFGLATDWPVSGDFDGDGKTDIAVFRPSNGTWYGQGWKPVQYGAKGDIPVVADYDGDGSDDFAVFRPSNATWYIKGMKAIKWGAKGDIPLRGDWNGDGSDDMVVFRPSNATWYFYGGKGVRWGRGSDIPLAGDFDGDGTNDLALFRPSENKWYFADESMETVQFGKAGDWPLPR
ncbi:hypothetical protein [Cryptosporangium sp. NPDC051539]|uniref:hypothetical protein n=1 Tax=Cryptosporangium sp. NPDC051539 TaxID=3363962 RepID=UPI0037947CBF